HTADHRSVPTRRSSDLPVAVPASNGAVKANGTAHAAARLDVAEPEVAQLVNEAGDDRDNIQPGDRVLLIVENDIGFSRLLLDTRSEEHTSELQSPYDLV